MTPKQELFAKEYLVDLNATRAAIRCGYSEKTAYSQGQRLLKDVEVSGAIQKAMDERSERTEITADDVLNRINRIAKAAEGSKRYSDSLKACELLGKHLRLFADRTEISGPDGQPLPTEFTVKFVKP